MHYRLDPTTVNLVHAICELVVLRRKIGADAPQAQGAIVLDILQDVAQGLAGHLGLPDSAAFARVVLKAAYTWQVAAAFRDTPGLSGFLCPPYFSMTDIARIQPPAAATAEENQAK